MKKQILLNVLILLIVGATSERLDAQWKMVASNVVPAVNQFGAMHYKEGVIWAGTTKLVSSIDLGKTWTNSSLPSGNKISSIQFFDRNIGLVSFFNTGLYITRDGGMTWKLCLPNQIIQSVFYKSANVIIALGYAQEIYTSTDGGATWITSPILFSGFCTSLIVHGDGVYAFGNKKNCSGNYDGYMMFSGDQGQTWIQKGIITEADSWNLSIDPCDHSLLYLVNEDFYAPGPDGFSNVFSTSNAGDSWEKLLTVPRAALSGAIATSTNTVNVTPATTGKMYRSKDKGISWKSIEAPNCTPDSRTIIAIDDNLLFLVDDGGNIWMTDNGGGDSVINIQSSGTLTFSPQELFMSDTISCDDTITRSITIQRTGCSPPNIVDVIIEGPAAKNYSVVGSSYDSIYISLLPDAAGKTSGILVIKRSDGVNDTIQLGGYRKKDTTPLTLSSSNAATDTIGGSVQIPITLNGLTKPQNIELTLHYDIGLDYRSSFSPRGTTLDIEGEQWKGRSKLRILGAVSAAPLGFANFDVFADSASLPKVTFDSLVVLDAASPCEYLLPLAVTSTITPPSGCGIQTLSRFVHFNQLPTLSIYPNPAQNSVTIASDADLGEATVTLIDMLGNQKMQMMMTFTKERSATIAIDDAPAGIYFVRVRSARGEYRLPFVVQR